MKYASILFVFSISFVFGQSKKEYLQENRFDLNDQAFEFPQTDFNIVGFGAYHGSVKTYEAEIRMIQSLKKQNLVDYYIPETNYSQAFFFQQYLESGDEELLKELTYGFQTIVAQEGTIETVKHWRKLRELNQKYPKNPIKVLGCDVMAEYKFPIMHMLLLTEQCSDWEMRSKLKQKLAEEDADFGMNDKPLQELLKSFVTDYEVNKEKYISQITDTFSFHHIVKNLKVNFEGGKYREAIIFDNYLDLKDHFKLAEKKQFFKYGFFHIEKQREQDFPSFFTRIIEQKVYDRDKVITVMGYLTKSEVLWSKTYDDQGNYSGYKIEKGYGIGDYWKEYFKGIKRLKKTKLSDITLFRLNNEGTPYSEGTDLIEVELFLKKSNGKDVSGKPTTDFIDYAVLISDSRNQLPLEEMK